MIYPKHSYAEAIHILNQLISSDEIKVDSLKDYINLYVNGIKVVYYKNRTGKSVVKMLRAQKKLSDLFDIGEFAAQMDANL